jgi:hypothetical protein
MNARARLAEEIGDTPREGVVLVEGFSDRAFVKGTLEYLGCKSPAIRQGAKITDIWGEHLGAGQFALRTRSEQALRIAPAKGRDNILRTAKGWLRQRDNELRTPMLLLFDADVRAADGSRIASALSYQGIRDSLIQAGCSEDSPNNFSLEQCRISIGFWSCNDPASEFLPDVQCLERLVIASIVAAYRDRAAPVKQWLASRPNPPESRSPKEFSWSHMAGWYADDGCDEFFQGIWRDEKIAAQLQQRLTDNGTWGILESLAQ